MKNARNRLLLVIVVACGTAPGRGQIVTDATFANVPAGRTLPASEGVFSITDDLGVLKGANRFHSFSEFGVPVGHRAVFTSDLPLKNILTRVTGGSMSKIQGGIESQVPGANLFLINPEGIRFESGAALELTGDFNASTADYLAFEDGAHFSATDPEQSRLTSAPPSAFGFLPPTTSPGLGVGTSTAPAHAEPNGMGVTVTAAELEVPDGKSLRLVGGDVTIEHAAGSLTGRTGVRAPGGEVLLAGAKSAGEVPLQPAPATGPLPLPAHGTIRVSGGSTGLAVIEATPASSEATPAATQAPNGRVVVRGGRLLIENGRLISDSRHAEGGLTVDIAVTEDVRVSGLQGVIRSDSFAPAGMPAEISVAARNLEVSGGRISVQTHAAGPGANVHLGTPGYIMEEVSLHDGQNLLDARTAPTATGAGATIHVNAADFTVRQGTLSLDNQGQGAGSTLALQADRLTLEGSRIFAGTFGPGPGGMVQLGSTSDPVDEVRLARGGRVIADSGELFSPTTGPAPSGPAGTIDVYAGRIAVDGSDPADSGFFAQTRGTEAAKGGTIRLRADQLTLRGPRATVSSSTVGEAPGGTIWILAGSLELQDQASIRSESTGQGAAGAVNILSRDAVNLRREALVSAAGPRDGEVSILAGHQIYLLESQVSASSSSDTGGNLFLGLPSPKGWSDPPADWVQSAVPPPLFVIMNRGPLNASSQGGVGGNVTVAAQHYVPSGDSLVNVTGTQGTGTPATPPGVDFSGDLATPIQARPEDLAEAQEVARFRPTEPAGYTPVGRRAAWDTGNERRLILERKPIRRD